MCSTLSVRIEASDIAGVRLWLAIDGEELFQLGAECLEESVLGPMGTDDGTVRLKYFRDSPNERVLSYGFCDEACCPSLLVTVVAEGEFVRWRGFRYTVPNPVDGEGTRSQEYCFHRSSYEDECRRALIDVIRHIERTRAVGGSS